jgi:DNA-binding PadR family transcriptional regulator
MPIQHAVLAMLARGESHGYELRSQFEQAIGPQWGELSISHLYQVLNRLVRAGHVTQRRVRQRDRPDRLVYSLTDRGRAELEDWLAKPFIRQSGYRDEFFLKLFAASRIGREALDDVLATQRKAYAEELRALGVLRGRHRSDPLVRLLIEAAVYHTEANLRVLDKAAEESSELSRDVGDLGAATARDGSGASRESVRRARVRRG